MSPSYRNWIVRGYMRRVIVENLTDELVESGDFEPVVVVFDPSGWEWEATAENGSLTSLTIRGRAINSRSLAHIPLVYLQDVATTYLAIVKEAWVSGANISDALREADLDRGDVRLSSETPDLLTFAEDWKRTPTRRMSDEGTRATPRREILATRYGVSVFTIDSLVKRARAENLIPPVKGKRRGRRPQTTDHNELSGNKERKKP